MGNIRYQRTAHRITSAVNCRPLKPSPRSICPAAPYPTGVHIPGIPPPAKFATEPLPFGAAEAYVPAPYGAAEAYAPAPYGADDANVPGRLSASAARERGHVIRDFNGSDGEVHARPRAP